MIHLSILSLILALITALLAFTGVMDDADWVARIGFLFFLILFIVSAAAMALKRDPPA